MDGKDGVIDREGRMVISPRHWLMHGGFSEGLFSVIDMSQPVGKWYGFMDRTGKLAIGFKFSGADDFHDGLAAVATGRKVNKRDQSWVAAKWGFIDKTGKFVIKPQFDYPNREVPRGFSEGFAAIPVYRPAR